MMDRREENGWALVAGLVTLACSLRVAAEGDHWRQHRGGAAVARLASRLRGPDGPFPVSAHGHWSAAGRR